MNRRTTDQFIRLYLLSTLVVLLMLVLSFNPAFAQSVIPSIFYLVTWNEDTHATRIWEGNTATNTSRQVLTLNPFNPATPSQIFPSEELNALNAAIDRGTYLRATADTPGIVQAIEHIWLVDANHLLVLTSNQTCDHAGTGCYGYFEFLFAEIATGNLTSLSKVSYSNGVVSSWPGCIPGRAVHVDTVLPHPTQEMFVFTLKPVYECYPSASQAYIVDYSVLPVTVREIPLADGISWSPDGHYLAYYTRESCQNSTCSTSIRILPIAADSTAIVLTQDNMLSSHPMFTAWTDSRTVMYQWLVSPTGGEGSPTLFWRDIVDNNVVQTSAMPFLPGEMYFLDQSQPHLLGLHPDRTAVGLTAQKALNVVANFPSVRQVFYNSRFNDALFFNLAGNSVSVIDAALNQTTFDLSPFAPTDMSERIYFVAPGIFQQAPY